MNIVVDRSLAAEFFGSRETMDIAAGSLIELVRLLDAMAPGFAEIAPVRAAFAVDGNIAADWSRPLSAASEIFLLPRVGGGQGVGGQGGDELPFRPLSPFGVEVLRDLSEPFTSAESGHFRDLFNDHGLILARGQSLTMERQHEICGLLGPILLREGENGYMSNEGGGPAAAALSWHADAAYTDDPFDALSLHALDVVDEASSTLFASAEAAAQTLPPALAQALEGREQEMISPHYTAISGRTCDTRDPEAQKRGVFPTFHTNPHNGRRCLWTSELQTVRVLEMEWEDSRDLLHAAYDHLYAPERVLEHRWRNGDFIVWDNIALQHARGELGQVGKRLLQRAIVGVAGVAPHIQAM